MLAGGGFEANPEWRARYLGPNWDLAKVRGTRFNTGDGIRMALDIGAAPRGNWSGCHAVGWDRNAPDFGDLAVGDAFQKHSYPFGIMLNAEGERFVDEGADFRNYTYAKYGRVILAQPGQFAWQVFDQKVLHLLRDEYRIRQVTKVTAAHARGTGGQARRRRTPRGADEIQALQRRGQQRRAVQSERQGRARHRPGSPCPSRTGPTRSTSRRSRRTRSPAASPSPSAGCASTPKAQVIETDGEPIPGLYAAGELVGGIFYFNYPGGSGLTSGAVFGRIAGASAARAAGSAV